MAATLSLFLPGPQFIAYAALWAVMPQDGARPSLSAAA
jgi:hypothetical protein